MRVEWNHDETYTTQEVQPALDERVRTHVPLSSQSIGGSTTMFTTALHIFDI